MGARLRKGFYWRGGVVWVRTDPIDKCARSTGCHDATAAYLWRAERERIAKSPTYAASLAESLGDWIERMLEIKTKTRSEGTVHMYGVKLGHFLRIWGEDAALAGVTAGAVDSYVDQRREEGAGNNTIARELSCLRQLLRHAKRAGQFAGDIADIMPIGFSSEYVPRTRTLRLDDFPKLWTALPSDEARAFVALAIAVGADTGDIERAEPEDYDAERGVVRVRGTKTETRDAEVPVLDHVKWLVEYAVAHMPIRWNNASHGVGKACKRAGIAHLSPKDLRRTAATWLYASGADQSAISRFLRHGSDAMVRKVYAQVKPEELGDLIRSQTSAKTLQVTPGPLAKSGKRGGFKRPGLGQRGGSDVERSRTCEPDDARGGAVGVPKTLQPSPELLRKSLEWFRRGAAA